MMQANGLDVLTKWNMRGVGTRDVEEALQRGCLMADKSVGEAVVAVYDIALGEGKKYVLIAPGKLSHEAAQRMQDVLNKWAHDPTDHFLVLDGGVTLAKVDEETRPQTDEGWLEYFAEVVAEIDRAALPVGKLEKALLCARYLLRVQIDEDVARRGREVINYALVGAGLG